MSLLNPSMFDLLAEVSLRALVLAAGVGLLLLVLRVRPGAVRHAAWSAVMVAMLLLPVLTPRVPAIPFWLPQTAALVAVEPAPAPPFEPPASSAAVSTIVVNAAAPQPAPPRVSAESASNAEAPASSVPWRTVLLAIWIVGAGLLLVSLAGGWYLASRLAARSRRSATHRDVFESGMVATPITVGVLHPRIVMPVSWTTWPEDVRQAALTHERAHVRRRDTAVDLLARINRAIFWFHPLAWWLERQVAVSAEQACDDEVVCASGDPRRYAEILVQMAEAVVVRGGRVAWQGVGMASGAALGDRIDRVLAGRAARRMSPAVKVLLGAACAVVIVLGVACQRTAPPLREDPELARRLDANREAQAKYDAAKAMTAEQAAALEADIAQHPDDLDAVGRLLYFYRESGQKIFGWNEMVARRRPHLLRLIEEHPESPLARWPLPQHLDPEGWAQARARWMTYVSRPDVTPKVLGAAAAFFGISEKPVAEQLLLRAIAMDPDGPQPRIVDNVYYSSWRAQLGELYARAIVGSNDDTLFNVVRSVSLSDAQGPFAAKAKNELATTTDVVLLRAAGSYLTRNARANEDGTVGDQRIALGFDHRALGQTYFDRAIAIDPDSAATKQYLEARRASAESEAVYERAAALLGTRWAEASPEQVAALSEADRLTVLPLLAPRTYIAAENAEYYRKDQAAYEENLARARELSEELLRLADRASSGQGPARYAAHLTLGLVVLREGNRRAAVSHLQAASASLSGDDRVTGLVSMAQQRLTNYLLKAGERETVADFFETVSNHAGPLAQSFTESARAIREGRMPSSYQHAMASR
jgi:beta-lactamase regulating signal transducer with metallopeptidase domain